MRQARLCSKRVGKFCIWKSKFTAAFVRQVAKAAGTRHRAISYQHTLMSSTIKHFAIISSELAVLLQKTVRFVVIKVTYKVIICY